MIHVSQPVFLGNEAAYVADALAKRQLSQGEYVRRFEEEFAKFCGTRYAVSCNSGTAALHLAMLALGVGRMDAVLVPALTYVATANAVRYCGAHPVFLDVDPETWTISVEQVAEWLKNTNVSGVIPVHLFGVPAAMSEIVRIAHAHGKWVVEDAAQAHGAHAPTGEHSPVQRVLITKRVGGLGDIGCFSFYANKILACGEGGMLTTNDEAIDTFARLYRGQGQHLASPRYFHSVIGYNYRMTEFSAAIGLAQLETYAEHAKRRRAVIERYYQELGTAFPLQRRTPTDANWLFTVLVDKREEIAEALLRRGIETRPVFPLLPFLPPYAHNETNLYPIARGISDNGLCLPTHAAMTMEDVDFVVRSLKEIVL